MTEQIPAPTFSFVLPAFNEGTNLLRMAERLCKAGEQLGEPFEIVWVNDGSSDETENVLEELAAKDPRIVPIHFARNFGHMAALTAGLEHARATGAVVCLDSDGQHPPEMIPELVEKWRDGADIVQTIRLATEGESFFKRTTSGAFYWLLNRMSDLELPQGAADFRLLDRQVVDALNALPERSRFLRGLVYWVGFRLVTVEYNAERRMSGVTKYNARKMLSFALNGITAFSAKPLRLSFSLGVVVLFLAGVYAAYILGAYFANIPLVRGWPSMLLATLLLSGIQLLMLGVLSEYLSRLMTEAKGRPIYIKRRPRSTRRG
ncbi:glycosyltransferase [bacterium]|nr:glycosyltransferase [bacterium]